MSELELAEWVESLEEETFRPRFQRGRVLKTPRGWLCGLLCELSRFRDILQS